MESLTLASICHTQHVVYMDTPAHKRKADRRLSEDAIKEVCKSVELVSRVLVNLTTDSKFYRDLLKELDFEHLSVTVWNNLVLLHTMQVHSLPFSL